MKNEEAIKILERGTTIPGDGYTWEQIMEALSTAVQALKRERAAPFSQVDTERFFGSWEGEADGYADGELVYDTWKCSVCGHVEETDDPDLLPDFCQCCGIALTERGRGILEKRLTGRQ